MLSFLLLLFVLYAVGVFISTIPYWYETPNSPCGDIPAQPLGLRTLVVMWWSALCAITKILAAQPLTLLLPWSKSDHEPARPEREYPPLLFIHGLYHNASGWVYLRRHLERQGFARMHAYTYSSWKTGMVQVTNRLDQAVAELEALYPGEKPILVGHSLGGLIIRNWFAANPQNQTRAQGVLTLGSPHKGSKMAAFACGELGRTLLPSNPFVAELARTEPKAVIPCLALASEADGMVLPQENLLPVTPGWDFRLTPYSTHVGLLTSPAVARMVAWELHRMSDASANPETAPEKTAQASVTAAEPVAAVTAEHAAKAAPAPAATVAKVTAAPKTAVKKPSSTGKTAPKANVTTKTAEKKPAAKKTEKPTAKAKK